MSFVYAFIAYNAFISLLLDELDKKEQIYAHG